MVRTTCWHTHRWYDEPTALLTKQAADSLRAVSNDVISMGCRLKIFDAYRPQKSVDHFVRWAADITDPLMKCYFYPDLDKKARIYIREERSYARLNHRPDAVRYDNREES